jgi:hypothetical protein
MSPFGARSYRLLVVFRIQNLLPFVHKLCERIDKALEAIGREEKQGSRLYKTQIGPPEKPVLWLLSYLITLCFVQTRPRSYRLVLTNPRPKFEDEDAVPRAEHR